MLIEINLLQEKEKKLSRSLIIILSVILIFVIAIAVFFFQIHSTKSQLAAQTEELNTMKQIRVLEEQNVGENVHSLQILESSIIWAEQEKLDIVMVLQHLTKLLPARGFIKEFTYTNESLNLNLQFDESKQAAFYITQLNHSEFISDAKLLSVVEQDSVFHAKYEVYLNIQAIKDKTAERGKE